MSVATARKAVSALDKLYASGFSDPVTDAILQKAVESQAGRDRMVLRDVERDLADMETQYGMASDAFYERWLAGELDDTADFMDWYALYQIARDIRQRLNLLSGEPQG